MSGHRITHLDVAWYQKGKKKPIGYTTQADADFYDILCEQYNHDHKKILEHLQDKSRCCIYHKELIDILANIVNKQTSITKES